MPRRMIDDGAPEDTEGNMPYRRGVESGEPTDDDTEGNMPLRKVDDGAPEDTEGNMPFRKLDEGEPDDTEGNAMKARG